MARECKPLNGTSKVNLIKVALRRIQNATITAQTALAKIICPVLLG
ncbi:hypothetical protein [Campylobacter gastrosuis]|uniref:Mobile element protein n=1 Tax=Campylobacter gastrosuis TaxID=2974576 RepID=A0ABT7HQI6_9BACT|nr:hypothetical protein [Campylobacter gastrosuis]MDL0088878.1 hypothetical protein [Campylobacter gastrosuis]